MPPAVNSQGTCHGSGANAFPEMHLALFGAPPASASGREPTMKKDEVAEDTCRLRSGERGQRSGGVERGEEEERGKRLRQNKER